MCIVNCLNGFGVGACLAQAILYLMLSRAQIGGRRHWESVRYRSQLLAAIRVIGTILVPDVQVFGAARESPLALLHVGRL